MSTQLVDTGIVSLCEAVIRQAFDDAVNGDDLALDWLLTTGVEWVQAFGKEVDVNYLRYVVKSVRERSIWAT